MSDDFTKKLKTLLVKQEDNILFPYFDTNGKITIGIGRNLSDRGISNEESLYFFNNDINYFTSVLPKHVPFFDRLSDNRKIVILVMCFNLGLNGLLDFNQMLLALEASDYERAADEILKSKAAAQLPRRYQFLAEMMRTDEMI